MLVVKNFKTWLVAALEKIKDIIEMKVAHRRNIDKRRKKWGYESGSLIGMNLGATNVICPDAELEEEECT